MTGASTNPKKLTLKETWTAWLILWKYSPLSLFLIRPLALFSGWGHVKKLFFSFWKCSPILLFWFSYIWGLFCSFFGPFGAIFGFRVRFKTFLEPYNVDYQFLCWKWNSIFSFLIWPNLGHFCTFWALGGYFWGSGQIQKLF